MKLKELFTYVREDANDKKVPYSWSDDRLKILANEAEVEACRRARLIKDSTTDEVSLLTLDANTTLYEVDPRVIFIRRAKLNSRTRPLQMTRTRDLDRDTPGWEANIGYLSHWVPDYDSAGLRFYRNVDPANTLIDPATGVSDFVRLTVVRQPLEEMAGPDDTPEILPRYHVKLTHWMLYRMFSKQDAEIYDADIAAKHLASFEAEFGPPSSAREEHWIDENFDYELDSGVY